MRFRLYPTPEQEAGMLSHCSHARYVYNLALEQRNFWRPGMRGISGYEQKRQLTEARAADDWLRSGSVTVQQEAILDLDQAFRNWWGGSHGRPTWRSKGVHEGFRIVGAQALRVEQVGRKWSRALIPKVGWVKFRRSRALRPWKSYRVTLNRVGEWHIAFAVIPDPIPAPGNGEIVGIDRGVTIAYQASDGRRWDVPGLNEHERRRLRLLQRKMARQQKGSKRYEQTRVAIAKLRAREAARRRDAIEKATTELARTADIVRIEKLRPERMTRSAKGTVEKPGRKVRQQAGRNREIRARGWAMFAERLGHKIGDRLEVVPAAFTSQRCHKCGYTAPENRESQAVFRCFACGHTDNADLNAALNIAAGWAVSARGGCGAVRPPDEARTTPAIVGSTT